MYAGLEEHVSFDVFAFLLPLFSECLGYPISNVDWLRVVQLSNTRVFLVNNIVLIAVHVQYFCFLQQSKTPALTIPSSSRFYSSFSEMLSNRISKNSRLPIRCKKTSQIVNLIVVKWKITYLTS